MKTITNVDKVNDYTSPVVKEIELSSDYSICQMSGDGTGTVEDGEGFGD